MKRFASLLIIILVISFGFQLAKVMHLIKSLPLIGAASTEISPTAVTQKKNTEQVTYFVVQPSNSAHNSSSNKSSGYRKRVCTIPPMKEFRRSSDTIVSEYFQVNINPSNLPDTFKQKLINKLNVIFNVYTKLLGTDYLKPVQWNINIFKNGQEYEQYIQGNGKYETDNSGVYFHSIGSANVRYRNDKQAIHTALHESVHAIHHALIGYMPGWLNEGMAEYFEYITDNPSGNPADISSDWTDKNGNFNYDLVDLPILINYEKYWYLDANEVTWQMYANSWLWIYYLMSSDSGQEVISSILKQELQTPCQILTEDDMYNFILDINPNIESDYLYWQEEQYSWIN